MDYTVILFIVCLCVKAHPVCGQEFAVRSQQPNVQLVSLDTQPGVCTYTGRQTGRYRAVLTYKLNNPNSEYTLKGEEVMFNWPIRKIHTEMIAVCVPDFANCEMEETTECECLGEDEVRLSLCVTEAISRSQVTVMWVNSFGNDSIVSEAVTLSPASGGRMPASASHLQLMPSAALMLTASAILLLPR